MEIFKIFLETCYQMDDQLRFVRTQRGKEMLEILEMDAEYSKRKGPSFN